MELKELTPAQIVIGNALNDSKVFGEQIRPELNERHFSNPFHRRLFNIMNELHASRGSFTLREVLDRIGDDLGPEESSEISRIIYDPLSSAPDIDYFVGQLLDKRNRAIQEYYLNKALKDLEEGKDISSLADLIKESTSRGRMEITSIQKSLEAFHDYIQEDSNAKLSTGIPKLDLQLAGGFWNSSLTVIGARSGHGKTAFALTLFKNIAEAGGIPYIQSIEMKDVENISRMMNAVTGLSNAQYVNHAKEFAEGYSRMNQWNAFIDDGRKVNTIDDIEKRVRYAVKKHHVDIIFIDYIQLINGASKARNRIEEVSAYSRRLKKLATEIDRPIVCLSQVTRSSDQRAPIRIKDYKFKVPEMIDLSDSSSLEKDADCILVLSIAENDDGTRPLLYNGRNPAILRIEKNRKGEKGHIIKLEFNGSLTSFTTGNW